MGVSVCTVWHCTAPALANARESGMRGCVGGRIFLVGTVHHQPPHHHSRDSHSVGLMGALSLLALSLELAVGLSCSAENTETLYRCVLRATHMGSGGWRKGRRDRSIDFMCCTHVCPTCQ